MARHSIVERRILESARLLFSSYGFAGASIRQIANHSLVSPQTIYAHFYSKTGLLVGLLDVLDEEASLGYLRGLISSADNPDDLIDLLAKAVRKIHQDCGDIVDIVHSSALFDPGLRLARDESIKRHRIGVEIILSRLRSIGVSLRPNASESALAIISPGVCRSLVGDSFLSFDVYENWLRFNLKVNLLESISLGP